MNRRVIVMVWWAAVIGATPALAEEIAATQPAGTAVSEPVIVTAQKRREWLQDVPLSVTPMDRFFLRDSDIERVGQAARYVPNVNMEEFTARKLSFPFFRGVGSGPINPSVTTFIDGVPQLNANSSSIELLNVERMEFIRGPLSTLYGRNTMGGAINIITRRPTNQWEFWGEATVGNYAQQDYRAGFSGPVIQDVLSIGLAGGYLSRNGFTINDVTGHDLDDREGYFGLAAVQWRVNNAWDVLLSFHGESDRDGDYALGDLNQIRATPFHVSHDFEGFTHRDVAAPTLTVRYSGENLDFTSISGFGWWRTHDVTDLDTTPVDLLLRDNQESMRQYTQELRFESPTDRPVKLSEKWTLAWIAGLSAFASNYGQEATNSLSAAAAAGLGVPFPFDNDSTAKLDDAGVGVYGNTTFTFRKKLDLSAGLRFDWEHKTGDLTDSTSPPISAPTAFHGEQDFTQVAPRFSIGYHWTKDLFTYASVAKGYKAGGFNSTAPTVGDASFDPETNWTYEVGIKSTWFNNRLTVNAALFYIDWNDMQLDVPNPLVPGRFFVANVGQAFSRGFEIELTAHPVKGWDIFAGFGYTDAQFASGSVSPGVPGNHLPFAPEYNWYVATQFTFRIPSTKIDVFLRGEFMGYGRMFYDATNAASQGGYFLAAFRAGLRTKHWSVEGWVRNAFDRDYVPLAFPFDPSLAPSGYVGENGTPRVFGVTIRVEW